MRITKCFEKTAAAGRSALIPYLMAGAPSLEATVDLMRALKAAGADLIELGAPFSDPMADGPAIQQAGEHALARHTNLRDVLTAAATFRRDDDDVPIVLMTYLNPIERMGGGAFAEAAAQAGVDGVLVVDLPPEEARDLMDELRKHGITMIFLLSLTTVSERMEAIAALAQGFVYCISLKGVTGSARLNLDEMAAHVATIKRKTTLPVGVGFGIRDAATAAAVADIADAVIVGSALVQIIEQHADDIAACKDAVSDFIGGLRRAMDAAGGARAVGGGAQ